MDFGSAFAISDPETTKLLRNTLDLQCLNNDNIIDKLDPGNIEETNFRFNYTKIKTSKEIETPN